METPALSHIFPAFCNIHYKHSPCLYIWVENHLNHSSDHNNSARNIPLKYRCIKARTSWEKWLGFWATYLRKGLEGNKTTSQETVNGKIRGASRRGTFLEGLHPAPTAWIREITATLLTILCLQNPPLPSGGVVGTEYVHCVVGTHWALVFVLHSQSRESLKPFLRLSIPKTQLCLLPSRHDRDEANLIRWQLQLNTVPFLTCCRNIFKD